MQIEMEESTFKRIKRKTLVDKRVGGKKEFLEGKDL